MPSPQPGPVPGELARKRELREKLAVLEQEARPRTTTITPPHAVDPAQAWPQGITLDGQREHRAEQLFDGSKADGEQAV